MHQNNLEIYSYQVPKQGFWHPQNRYGICTIYIHTCSLPYSLMITGTLVGGTCQSKNINEKYILCKPSQLKSKNNKYEKIIYPLRIFLKKKVPHDRDKGFVVSYYKHLTSLEANGFFSSILLVPLQALASFQFCLQIYLQLFKF